MLRKAWLNIQLMFYDWLLLTHPVLYLSFGCQASGNQHFGRDRVVERAAAVGAGMADFETGLGSHLEGMVVER